MQLVPSHLLGVPTWTEDFLCLDHADTSSFISIQPSPRVENSAVPTSSSIEVPLRRSSRITHKPTWLADCVSISATATTSLSSQYQAYFSTLAANSNLVHFSITAQDQKWCEAMNKELRALEDNGTWEINTLPSKKAVNGCIN